MMAAPWFCAAAVVSQIQIRTASSVRTGRRQTRVHVWKYSIHKSSNVPRLAGESYIGCMMEALRTWLRCNRGILPRIYERRAQDLAEV